MMLGGKKGKYPAFIGVITAIFMTFISIIPFLWEIPLLSLSVYGAAIVFLLGAWLTSKAIKLYQKCDDVTAKQLMLSSFAYLPLMQIVYMLDKFVIQ